MRSSMLLLSPTITLYPAGAPIALRMPTLGPRAGKLSQLILLPPDERPVTLAPQWFM